MIFLFCVAPPQSSSSSEHWQFQTNPNPDSERLKPGAMLRGKGVDRIQSLSQTSLRCLCLCLRAILDLFARRASASAVEHLALSRGLTSPSARLVLSPPAGQHASDTSADGAELQQLQQEPVPEPGRGLPRALLP